VIHKAATATSQRGRLTGCGFASSLAAFDRFQLAQSIELGAVQESNIFADAGSKP
jgi:hypothetical protein